MMQRTLFVLIIFFASCSRVSHGQSSLIINEDRPSLIDALLQVVWEPSSLVRFWTALDQLYNIGLSWRTVAKTVVTLPFRNGRSMSHVKIQEPRRARGMIKYQTRQMDLNHLDRFNKIYSDSSSPSFQFVAPTNIFETHVMPPPFFLPPQKMVPELPQVSQFLVYNKDNRHFPDSYRNKVPIQNLDPKYQEWLFKEIAKGSDVVQKQLQSDFGTDSSSNVEIPFPLTATSIQSANPEIKLRMFLKLMKDLGEIHSNKVIFDDDLKEGIR